MKIVCKNSNGQQLAMGWFPPLWIASVDGLGTEYNVYTSKNSGQDGENYTGGDAKMRNIVITLDIAKSDYRVQRNRLYSFFQPRSEGTLYYYEGDESRKIKYYVEKVTPGGDDNDTVRTLTISLICPDPKFYALSDQITQFAVWQGKITFPLRLPPQINAEGQSATLTVDDSIKDYDKIAITGATVQDGSGDPSPDNVRPIHGATSLTISDGGGQSQTITLPQPLYSLPDGTADEYDAVSGAGVQNVKSFILSGSSVVGMQGKKTNTCEFFTVAISEIGNSVIISDTFKSIADIYTLYGIDTEGVATEARGRIFFRLLKSRLTGWSDDWTMNEMVAAANTWLSAHPVTVLYQLATPQAISGTAQTVPIYHPTTILSLDAGTLALRCRGRFTVTEKTSTLIGNVVNPSAVPMGLTVTFRASGTVINPSLYDVNRRELMQINTTMHAGDVIIVTTGDGNKRVKLISGGVTSNINNLMAYPPHWLQVQQGDNLYRYNADSGIDTLSVSILSTQAYWGA